MYVYIYIYIYFANNNVFLSSFRIPAIPLDIIYNETKGQIPLSQNQADTIKQKVQTTTRTTCEVPREDRNQGSRWC